MSFYVSKWFTCAHSAMGYDRLIASWFFYLKCEYAPWAWLSPGVWGASQSDSHRHRHGPLLERLELTDSLRVNWVSLRYRRRSDVVCLNSANVTSTFDHFCMLLSQRCVWLHRVFNYTECSTTQCLTTQSVRLHRVLDYTECLTKQSVRLHRVLDCTECLTTQSVWLHNRVFDYTECLTTQSVCLHRVFDYTECLTTQSVCLHRVLDYTECWTTQSVELHRVFDYTECWTTQSVWLHRVLDYTETT